MNTGQYTTGSYLKRYGVWLLILLLGSSLLEGRISYAEGATASSWVEASAAAPWPSRFSHATVVFDNKLWILGGSHKVSGDYTMLDDVWSSTDGIEWIQATDHAPWPPRVLHAAVVFAGKIWVLGGLPDDGPNYNDVWCSSDGSNWTRVVEHAPWRERFGLQAVVFNDRLWVLAGRDFDEGFSDVWSSEDGENWIQAAAGTPWQARWKHAAIEFDERLWIFGGVHPDGNTQQYLNDVWCSMDEPARWTQVCASAPWHGRSRFSVALFEGDLWIMAGMYGLNYPREELYFLSDIWRSTDGTNWVLVSELAPWGARCGQSSADFDGRLWVIGGQRYELEESVTLNDVWYLPSSASEGEGEGEGEGEPPAGPHTADRDGDWRIGIIELLRVIQFYNAGGFHCAANPVDTEDGYLPGADADQACAAHAADYLGGPSWTITLSELLRLIQLYNAGAYHLCPGDEGGYCPGAG